MKELPAPGLPIAVEVAYALPDTQLLLSVSVPAGTTARDAVQLSGIADHFADLDIATADLGVFAKPVDGSYVLEPGDRVEIYRPLIADPKVVRRSRAEQAKPAGPRARRQTR